MAWAYRSGIEAMGLMSGPLPALAEPDRVRRESDDAREQLLEVALLHARDRVAVGGKGGVDRRPVFHREVALGERQHLLLFLAHVLPVELGIGVDRLAKFARPHRPAFLHEQQRALELADQ